MGVRKASTKGKGKGRGKRGSKARLGINPSYHAPKNFCETIKFKQVISQPASSGAGGTVVDLSFPAQILPLLNGNLTSIYRQFNIRGVKITYQPSYNNYPQTAGVAQAPKIYMVEDKTVVVPDNSSVNVEALLMQDNARVLSPFRKWSQYVKFPKPLTMSTTDEYGGSMTPMLTAVQTPSNRPLWLSLQAQAGFSDEVPGTTVPHLIGRMVADDNNSAFAITLGTLYYKVYYSVKEQTAPTTIEIYGAVRQAAPAAPVVDGT